MTEQAQMTEKNIITVKLVLKKLKVSCQRAVCYWQWHKKSYKILETGQINN